MLRGCCCMAFQCFHSINIIIYNIILPKTVYCSFLNYCTTCDYSETSFGDGTTRSTHWEYFQAQRSTLNKILSINSVRSWVALAISPSKSIDFWTVEKPRRRRACPIQNDDCKVNHKLIHLRITILIIKQ